MQRPDGRIIRRTFLGTWLAAGVSAMGYVFLVSGCTPATPVVEAATPSVEIDSLEKAEQAWRAGTIAEHEPIWKEESGPGGDPFAAGLAAFHLASATYDPAWSNLAVDAFDRALEANPGFALRPCMAGFRPRAAGPRLSLERALADRPRSRIRPPLPRQGGLLRPGRGSRDHTGRSSRSAHPRIHLPRDAAGVRGPRRRPRGLRQAA